MRTSGQTLYASITGMNDTITTRARSFLAWVVSRAGDRRCTTWGEYRAFECYASAAFALGEETLGRRLFDRTLDNIAAMTAEEEGNPSKCWHLADFALVPALRIAIENGAGVGRASPGCGPTPEQYARLRVLTARFIWHDSSTENHNLLHLTARVLAGRRWPELMLRDGRSAAVHAADAAQRAVLWLRSWRCAGSSEWGSDIYGNVLFISLLALADHAPSDLARQAGEVAGLLALEGAIDLYAGAPVGAARRSYGAYRCDPRDSPARPLFAVWAGTGGEEPWNANFIGGVIQACIARWRPPEAVLRIAREPTLVASGAHHIGLYARRPDEPAPARLGKHLWRQREGVISAMHAWPSADRQTEMVWQATIGVGVPIFACQPASAPWQAGRFDTVAHHQHEFYCVGGESRYWMPGNMPPGHHGDLRPGWWSGHRHGPRSCGWNQLAASVYRIPADDPFPYVHVLVPRDRLDGLTEEDGWLWLRSGDGYLGLWTSAPRRWPGAQESIWAGQEVRLDQPCQAVLAVLGGASTDGNEQAFRVRARALAPVFSHADAALTCATPAGILRVAYDEAPRLGEAPLAVPDQRLATPWGAIALDSGTGIIAPPGCAPLQVG